MKSQTSLSPPPPPLTGGSPDDPRPAGEIRSLWILGQQNSLFPVGCFSYPSTVGAQARKLISPSCWTNLILLVATQRSLSSVGVGIIKNFNWYIKSLLPSPYLKCDQTHHSLIPDILEPCHLGWILLSNWKGASFFVLDGFDQNRVNTIYHSRG